jgi:hypothetical protein
VSDGLAAFLFAFVFVIGPLIACAVFEWKGRE